MQSDLDYMKRVIALAQMGIGKVNPNPLVGCVIVKGDYIIGEGYHQAYGNPHAEIEALNHATVDVEGATLYVNLEPCSHYGKTPPCVEAIVAKKIKRVVIGCLDPNPLVAGKGIKYLRDAGIEVEVGVLEKECLALNEIFIKYVTTTKPFVWLKVGMSLDGKISTYTGESKWITSETSRSEVHQLRNRLMGIMVGADTVIQDNPQLTCCIEGGRQPIRIIVDSCLRVPCESGVFNQDQGKTIVATTEQANCNKVHQLMSQGVEVLQMTSKNGRVNLPHLMELLGDRGIDSILLEGGGTLNFSALDEQIVDKITCYIAPKIIGGKEANTPVSGKGVKVLADAIEIEQLAGRTNGQDWILEGRIKCLQE